MKKQFRISSLMIGSLSIFFIITAFDKVKRRDCDDAKSYAENAYRYFKKAYNASTLDEAQYNAKKGMNNSSDAETKASDSDCSCDDAENEAGNAYSYGKKAYNASSVDDAKYYAKKAMNAASNIKNEAEDCEGE